MAQKHYRDSIDVVNKDKVLKTGGVIQDLVDKYWEMKECFEFKPKSDAKNKPFAKDRLNYKRSSITR